LQNWWGYVICGAGGGYEICGGGRRCVMWTSTPAITQACARQLNNQVSSFLTSYSSYLDNGNMCSALFAQERQTGTKRSCIRDGDIRILEQQQLVTASLTMYGLGFRRANTLWKAPVVYFHMHQTSSPYHVGAGHNHYFGAETFFCQRCCDTLFWPIGLCIMLSPIQTRPRVGARPSLPEVILPHP
jgi:hypothetical protein